MSFGVLPKAQPRIGVPGEEAQPREEDPQIPPEPGEARLLGPPTKTGRPPPGRLLVGNPQT